MSDKPSKRRWLRFNLRTLLLLVTVACAGFGWLGVKMRQAQRQKEAVEAIRTFGGLVCYDYEPSPSYGFTHPVRPPGPEWIRQLFGVDMLAKAHRVWLAYDYPVNELWRLGSLPRVRFLSINNVNISDSDLVHLTQLKQLDELVLRGTQATAKGCQELQRALPNLRIER